MCIRDRSVVTTFGKVPPSESKILLGQTFSKRTICQYEKSVLFSYSTSKYVYQFKNGELCDSFLMQANHFTPPNIDFDYMNGGNKDNLGSYSSKFSFYNNIFCNENFIMRIASNPYKEIDKDGNFVFPVNKSWSMIISDTKFNLIYEIAVPEYLLDFTTCMQTDKGFYIRSLKKSSVLYYYEVFK